MICHLINSNNRYFASINVGKRPAVPFTTVSPPQAAIDALQSSEPPTQSAEWDGSQWTLISGAPMDGYVAPPVQYRTEVTAEEFIGLWSNDHWGEAVTSTDPIVVDFVTKLKNYKKTFDTGANQVTTGMTAVVQNTSMDTAYAQQIVKGVRL